MKKSVIFVLFVLIGFHLQANFNPTTTFVIIGDETIYCDKIQMGKVSTKIYLDGNVSLKIPTNKIRAYAQNGTFYEYLPVLNERFDTTGWAFMEYIVSHDGNRLYRYCSNCLKYDPVNETIAPVLPIYRYYIFKGNMLVTVTNDDNLQATVALFGVKVVG
jgi:hypothetical protein